PHFSQALEALGPGGPGFQAHPANPGEIRQHEVQAVGRNTAGSPRRAGWRGRPGWRGRFPRLDLPEGTRQAGVATGSPLFQEIGFEPTPEGTDREWRLAASK